jgi:putative DNA primase/helicase
VNVAQLLDDIRSTVRRFIVCEPETATAAAIWIAFTWIIDHVHVAPLAVITAPEKRCGKTQLLDLIGRLSRRNLFASNISPAATFRVIEAKSPTLLIDEADAFFRENEELRGVINSGHTRTSAYVIRTVGDDFEVKQFSTWGAKAIAGIGKLADTVMDRAIVLALRRKGPDEKVERLRHAEPGLFDMMARKLARFGEDHGAAIGRAKPALPDALNDRAQDNWEPLLAIADFAGGRWPTEARRAALAISGESEQELSIGEQLLAAIRDAFEQDSADKLSREELLRRLVSDEEAPWATWNKGKPMTAEQFRRRLKPYGIATKKVRTSRYETAQGFDRGQFKDAWSRYLDAGNASSGAPSESRNNGTTEAIQDVERSDRVPIPPIDRNTEHVPAPDATRVPENEAVPIEVGTWNTNGTCKPLKSSGCSSVPVAAPLPAKEEAGALPWSVEL